MKTLLLKFFLLATLSSFTFLSTAQVSPVITYSYLNPQIVIIGGVSYFDFDFALSDNAPSFYFYALSTQIQYDTLVFGAQLVLNNGAEVIRGTLIMDSASYRAPRLWDQGRNRIILGITAYNPHVYSITMVNLDSVPVPAVHLRLKIQDCLATGIVTSVNIYN
jgi:hypothetical protein